MYSYQGSNVYFSTICFHSLPQSTSALSRAARRNAPLSLLPRPYHQPVFADVIESWDIPIQTVCLSRRRGQSVLEHDWNLLADFAGNVCPSRPRSKGEGLWC